jgi:hypothetical protein
MKTEPIQLRLCGNGEIQIISEHSTSIFRKGIPQWGTCADFMLLVIGEDFDFDNNIKEDVDDEERDEKTERALRKFKERRQQSD